jgi:hypothetical protein
VKAAAVVVVAVFAIGCGSSHPSSPSYTEAQVVKRLHLQATDVGYTSPAGCHFLVVLNTPQEVDVYNGDAWLVTNKARTVGVKVSDGPASCPSAQAELDRLP